MDDNSDFCLNIFTLVVDYFLLIFVGFMLYLQCVQPNLPSCICLMFGITGIINLINLHTSNFAQAYTKRRKLQWKLWLELKDKKDKTLEEERTFRKLDRKFR